MVKGKLMPNFADPHVRSMMELTKNEPFRKCKIYFKDEDWAKEMLGEETITDLEKELESWQNKVK